MTTTPPQTYIHSAPLATLAPHLLPHLPKSLPLLRRLQFHTASPSARIIATFPPPSSSPSPSSPTTTTNTAPPASFAAIWADRTRAPETECWIFSTFETLPPPPPTPSQRHEARAQCLALLAVTARLPATTPLTIIGSLNESLLRLIGGEEVGRLAPQKVVSRGTERDDDDDDGTGTGGGGVVRGISVPYCKWLIGPPGAEGGGGRWQGGGSLPPGYAFDELRGEDELKLTIARTEIPKTEETLAQLGCCGVRHTPGSASTATATATRTAADAGEGEEGQGRGALVAWAFLGVDGSLTSLHVEPEHRGRGLAKAVSRRLFRSLADDASAMGFRAADGAGDGVGVGGYGRGEGWAHSDVAEENLGSAGVARAMGGEEGWRVRWVSVDLAAVAEERGTKLLGEEVVV